MFGHSVWLWLAFNCAIIVLLVLDLKVFHRDLHEVKLKESLTWTVVWIALALAFNVWVYQRYGAQSGMEFLTGYLIEKSLSVDNLFVFLLIFNTFKVPAKYQHEVLFWGILGALIMRAIFIFAGVTLIHHFHWIIYVFGAFLVFTGIRLAFEKDKEIHPENNPVLRLFKKMMPVSHSYEGGKFFFRQGGKLFATPLVIVLLVVETTDVIFAVDSIPAILAITQDPFIVYTSNVFAILGLRALYFALSSIMEMFEYLHYGLAFILVFVGIKMLVSDLFHFPTWMALGVVATALTVAIIASIRHPGGGPELHPTKTSHKKARE